MLVTVLIKGKPRTPTTSTPVLNVVTFIQDDTEEIDMEESPVVVIVIV